MTANSRTKTRTKTNIPMIDDFTKSVGRLRKDVERTVERVSRQATRYLPEKGRRQLDELVDRVSELSGTVTKTVDNVYADVEERVSDLRGTVEKQVKALRKDTTSVTEKAFAQIEKEARKQIDRLLKTLGVMQRSDLDGIKRRISAIERKLDELAKEVQEAA